MKTIITTIYPLDTLVIMDDTPTNLFYSNFALSVEAEMIKTHSNMTYF